MMYDSISCSFNIMKEEVIKHKRKPEEKDKSATVTKVCSYGYSFVKYFDPGRPLPNPPPKNSQLSELLFGG